MVQNHFVNRYTSCNLLIYNSQQAMYFLYNFAPDCKQEVKSFHVFCTKKSSEIMSIPDKIQEPRNVDLAAAGRGVWLVKVPRPEGLIIF